MTDTAELEKLQKDWIWDTPPYNKIQSEIERMRGEIK